MKKKSGFAVRQVCGETFLIAEGLQNIDFSKLIALNETSTYLWNKLQPEQEFTEDDLVELLTAEYEVTQEQAAKDVHALVESMLEAGVIE